MTRAPDPNPALTPDLAARIKAYPGTLTFHDLIRKNKRASVVLIGFMLVLGVLVGAAIGVAIGSGRSDVLLPAAVTGAFAALVAGSLAVVWSWFGGAGAVLGMLHAKPLQKADDPELFNVVEELSIAAGVPMPKVYLIPETAMNAFATGRDPAHGVVAITTGLRQNLSRDELQGVMAHEMAHIRHLDIRFSLLMATLAGLIVFASDAFRRMAFFGGLGRGSRSKEGGGAAALLFIVAILLSILAPFAAMFIQMAYSRQREYLADAGAVELTRNPLGLVGALRKLAADHEPLVDLANRGTAHMFIVNPLRKMRNSEQSLNSAFSSHPPVKERIARLMALTR